MGKLETVGCARIQPGRCWVEPEVTVHLRAADAQTAWVQGQALALGPAGVLHIPAPSEPREVRLTDADGRLLARVTLESLSELPAAEADLRACAQATSANRARAARCASRLGRERLARGDLAGAQRWFTEAETNYEGAPFVEPKMSNLLALAFHALWRHDELALARRLLDRARPLVLVHPSGGPRLAYYEGLWARRVGDLVGAARHLAQAEAGFRTWDLTALALGSLEMWAVNARDLGQGPQALKRLKAASIRTGDLPPCIRARLDANLGWIRFMESRRPQRDSVADPRPPLKRALRVYEGACRSEIRGLNARLNLALAELAAGRTHEARALAGPLVVTATSALSQDDRAWKVELSGRLALADGRLAQARHAFEDMRTRLGASDAAILWRAWLGLGDVAKKTGRLEEALTAYEEAEQTLAQSALLLPLDGGRSAYLTDRRRSVAGVVSVALALGKKDRAFCAIRRAARRARADLARHQRISSWPSETRRAWTNALERYLRLRRELADDVSEDWGRSQAELDVARKGRASLRSRTQTALRSATRLLEDDPSLASKDCSSPGPGWGIVAVPQAAAPTRFLIRSSVGDIRATSEPMPDLGPGTILTVYPGPLSQLRGLLSASNYLHRWSLDLTPLAPGAGLDRRRVVVVANPGGDLELAEDEGRFVAKEYRKLGFEVTLLTGADASWPAVAQALPDSLVFHYAGHGLRSTDQWGGDALQLAQRGQLTAADLLVLPRGPTMAVLTGCRTAAEPAVGLSLAEALLTAGTQSVVAAARAAGDQVSARLGACLARTTAAALLQGEKRPLERGWLTCGDRDSRNAGFELWVR